LFAKKLMLTVQSRQIMKKTRKKKKAHTLTQSPAKFVLVRLLSQKPMVIIHLLDAYVEEVHPHSAVEAHNAHDAIFHLCSSHDIPKKDMVYKADLPSRAIQISFKYSGRQRKLWKA